MVLLNGIMTACGQLSQYDMYGFITNHANTPSMLRSVRFDVSINLYYRDIDIMTLTQQLFCHVYTLVLYESGF